MDFQGKVSVYYYSVMINDNANANISQDDDTLIKFLFFLFT